MLRTILLSTVRQYSRKRVTPRRRNPNPGIENRMKTIGIGASELLDNDVDLEELEADFFGAHKSYNDYEKEIDRMFEKERHDVVRHKYFKREKQPAFLTWNDVEQIRYLHQKDPEEWTIDRLSDSFPALPEVIHKICKTNYVRSDENIENYNEMVKHNWKQFKAGHLKLPPDLKEHLNKFSSRELNFTRFTDSSREKAIKSLPKPQVKKGSFSEIITSYKQLKSQDQQSPPTSSELIVKDFKSQLNIKHTKHQKQVTLTELATKLEQKKLLSNGQLPPNENILLETVEKHKKPIEKPPPPVEDLHEIIDLTTIKKDATVQAVKHKRDMSHLFYPEKIPIPKQHYKRGLTYKLNDCFYDSQGYFLYRVPGME